MSAQHSHPCPRCEGLIPAGGRFCTGCGAEAQTAPRTDGFCIACGGPLASGARFCNGCGTAVGTTEVSGLRCAQCHAELQTDVRFCTTCGAACGAARTAAPAPLPAAVTTSRTVTVPTPPPAAVPPPVIAQVRRAPDPPPAARPTPDLAKPGGSRKFAAAAVVVLALGATGVWLALRDGGTGTSAAYTSGTADDERPTATPEAGEPGAARSAGRATDTASGKAPPGTKGVGGLRPSEPPRELVKDPCTLEIEKVIDELMKEQP